MGIVQSKTLQNLVVLMEPSDRARNISLKAGNMILNRFCIDEDAAFELSGVNSLEKTSCDKFGYPIRRGDKGKEHSF